MISEINHADGQVRVGKRRPRLILPRLLVATVAMVMHSLITACTFVTKLPAALLKYQVESEGRFFLSLCVACSSDV